MGNIDKLVRQAELKGINLLRMPNGMERRRFNTTKFNKKKAIISWKLELYFHFSKNLVHGDEKGTKGNLRLLADKPLSTVVRVEGEASELSTLAEQLGKYLEVSSGNSAKKSPLQMFAAVPRDSLAIFMKRLPCSSTSPRYFKLDPDATLMDSLKGKTIIEYPTIDVVMRDDTDRFPLIIGEPS